MDGTNSIEWIQRHLHSAHRKAFHTHFIKIQFVKGSRFENSSFAEDSIPRVNRRVERVGW